MVPIKVAYPSSRDRVLCHHDEEAESSWERPVGTAPILARRHTRKMSYSGRAVLKMHWSCIKATLQSAEQRRPWRELAEAKTPRSDINLIKVSNQISSKA